MQNKWQEQLCNFGQQRIPLITSLLLVLLFFMPLGSVDMSYFRPSMGIICVYYWRLNRRMLFGFFSAFLIGFILDVHSSTPLGVNILLMLILVWLTDLPSRYLQTSSFGMRWLIFSVVCLAVFLCKWLILMLYFWHLFPATEAMLGYFSTVMFYPLIASINVKIAQKFLPPENIDEQ